LLAVLALPIRAQEAPYTAEDVEGWIQAYSAEYATPRYPYVSLVADAERVASCESARFDSAVINNARRGRLGEIGTFQFMPGARSIFWSTPSAAAGWDMWDAEANVAGAIWLISRGYGPRHWSCW
jgi:hypothetical protein